MGKKGKLKKPKPKAPFVMNRTILNLTKTECDFSTDVDVVPFSDEQIKPTPKKTIPTIESKRTTQKKQNKTGNTIPRNIGRNLANNLQSNMPVQPEPMFELNQPGPSFELNQSVDQDQEGNRIRNDPTYQGSDQYYKSVDKPLFVDTSSNVPQNQVYSPSDVYEEGNMDITGDELCPSTYSSDTPQTGRKRISAFQRLGPQTQPKTPKITINLNLQQEEPVREVVDLTDVYDDEKYSPVHLRPNVLNSTDDIVMKYLANWPWKKDIRIEKFVSCRNSKSAMMLELQKMEVLYDRDTAYFLVDVRKYPASWTKEDVLDAVLESVKDKSFIPCFINFTKRRCSFFVMKSKPALVEIHKNCFAVHKSDVELHLYISTVYMNVNHLDFVPRLVLRKRVMGCLDGETKLNLREFTLKEDISHFIYFPLNRVTNQTELTELQTVSWNNITHLDLSYNRLTTIIGFDLLNVTPKLKHLDLSHNLLNKITDIFCCRNLPLNSISLEGNPLCLDYIDEEHYIKVIRMMFPMVNVIDGEKLHIPGSMPSFKQHYCRHDAKMVVDRFLEVFFPLFDSDEDQRGNIKSLYDPKAVMTVTYNGFLRCKPVYRSFRNLFMLARDVDDGKYDSLEGISVIMKLVKHWPAMQHDPFTFNVDVIYHNETVTIVRVCGVMKLTAKTLADDEYLLAFTRTLVLKTKNGSEYKICNDMVYWDVPTNEYVKTAFQRNTITSVPLSFKFESEPDKDIKEKLLKIFIKITDSDKETCLRHLNEKNWHMKDALEHYVQQLTPNNRSNVIKA